MNGRDGDRGTVIVAGSSAGGLGFAGALTLVFIVLRLTGHIDWSWWWILAPAWITGSLVLLLLIAATVLFVGAGMAEARAREERWRERTGRPQPQQHGPAHRWGHR